MALCAVALSGCGEFTFFVPNAGNSIESFHRTFDQSAQAVAWVQRHAREFGGDPDRIVLMGPSAGARIAALLALNPSYLTAAGVHTHYSNRATRSRRTSIPDADTIASFSVLARFRTPALKHTIALSQTRGIELWNPWRIDFVTTLEGRSG